VDDDQALLTAWAAGDRTAGARFISSFYAPICRFFATKGGDHADDLVQQTFAACTGSLTAWRGVSSARAFLFGIARNVLFEHIRRRVRDGRSPPDFRTSALVDLVPGIQTQASLEADRQRLAAAMQTIPLELQVALELYYWEDLSIEELGAVLSLPAGTVKSRLHRARAAIRVALDASAHPESAGLRRRGSKGRPRAVGAQ
jgi:RNA polymerase sigma factor (sigma-70 family)